jgi:hypothetical protein
VVVGFEPRPYGPLAADDSVSRACASRPTLLLTIPGHYQQEPWVIAGCRRFRKKLGAESVADVLLQNRLVPGLGIFDARKECAARFGTARCTPHLQGPQKYFATH